MLPNNFNSQEEILHKLREIAKVHDFSNFQTIAHIFYDVIKISYYALVRKIEGLKGRVVKVTLKRNEITRLVKLIDYHHVNDNLFPPDHELVQCFGPNYNEDDALKFFENYVEGPIEDRFGNKISISLDDGVKFMYKNKENGRHELKTEFYIPSRGKRLPWIRHTIKKTTNIYFRRDNDDREFMYISKYELPKYDDQSNNCYWVVITKKYYKDTVGPYKFKTAFPVFKYNSLLKRMERYQPINCLKNI